MMAITRPIPGIQLLAMTTNTAETERLLGSMSALPRTESDPPVINRTSVRLDMKRMLSLTLVMAAVSSVHASTNLGPWVPIFKGIDHAVGTNTPGGGGFPDLQAVHAIRIELTDPDIRLVTTPRITNYTANSRETAGMSVSDFLVTKGVQVAINANNFHDPGTLDSPSYTLPTGT